MTKELEKKICAEYVVLREDYSAKDSKAMLATDYGIDIDELNAIIARGVSRRKKEKQNAKFEEWFRDEWEAVTKDVLAKTKGMVINISKEA